MSDIMVAQAEQLRTLALNEEQDIETARHRLEEATARRDRFLAAADLLCPATPPAVVEVIDTWNAAMASAVDAKPDTSSFVEVPVPQVKAPKQADKSPAKKSGPKGGRPHGHDYAEVARLANEARQRGIPAANYVADQLGITLSAGRNAVGKARALGHKIIGGRSGPMPKSDPSKLAPAKPVADRQPRTADELPAPADRPKPAPTVIAADVRALRCQDCDFVLESHRALAMRDHVTQEHGRRILDAERTPRTWVEANS